MNNEQMEEIKRYFGVVAEGLRNEIRQVTEGHAVIGNEIQSLREENGQAHREILSAQFIFHPMKNGPTIINAGHLSPDVRLRM